MMKHKILLLAFTAALFTGCSTAYKAAQTPDDVYYSPARERAGGDEARYDDRKESRRDRYESYVDSDDDRYLRMKIQNRSRWSSLDDFDYWYSPRYSFNFYGNNYGRYNPYLYNSWSTGYINPFWNTFNNGWYGSYYPSYSYGFYNGYNNWHTPSYGYYAPTYIIKNPVRQSANVARPSLGGYNNRNYNNSNSNTNRQGLGNMMRRVLTPAPSNNNSYNSNRYSNSNNQRTYSTESNNSATYDRPVRTYTPSSSSSNTSSGSSSGSSGGGGGVSRQSRTGN